MSSASPRARISPERLLLLGAAALLGSACAQILGDDFTIGGGGTGGTSSTGEGGGATSSAGGAGGATTAGGGTPTGSAGGGGAAPACGGPGELCCTEGVPCEILTCVNGTCPDVATLVQVPKPAPYTGTYGIDETEVTRKQYETWLMTNPTNSGALLGPGCAGNGSFVPEASCMALTQVCTGANCGQHPQVCVDWCDAFAYCAAVGKKLCNHVESGLNASYDANSAFVNACTSGGVNDYSPGANAGDCRTGGWITTQEVKATPTCQSSVPGFEGVYDLTGNVSEWVDVCDSNNSPNANCIAGGGSFDSDPPYELCIYPQDWPRMDHRYVVGFRCCEL
ncbi:MAG: SUMF1/EgtB/PvdO family nonheme iron enzyme [Polyangiaceae bacterium]